MVNSDDERVNGDNPEEMDTTVSPNEDKKCITIVSSQLSSLNFTTSITSSPTKKPKVNAIDDFMNDLTSESSEDEQFEASKPIEKFSVDIDCETSSSEEDTNCENSESVNSKETGDSALAPFKSFKDACNSSNHLTNGVDYNNPQPSGSGVSSKKKKVIEEITLDSDDSSVEVMDTPLVIKSKGGKSSNPLKIKNSSAKKLFLLKNKARLRYRDTSTSFSFENLENSNVGGRSIAADRPKEALESSGNKDIKEILQVLPFLSRDQVEEAYAEYPMCSNRRHVTLSVLIASAESDGKIVSTLAYQKLVSWSRKRKNIEGSDILNDENAKRFALNEANSPNKLRKGEFHTVKDNEAKTFFNKNYRKPHIDNAISVKQHTSALPKADPPNLFISPVDVLYTEEEPPLFPGNDDHLFSARFPLQDDSKFPPEDEAQFPLEDDAHFPPDEVHFPPEDEARFSPEAAAHFPPEEETLFPPDEVHVFRNDENIHLPPENNAQYGHHEDVGFGHEVEIRPMYNELMYPHHDEAHNVIINVNEEENDAEDLELIEPLPVVEPTPLPYVGGVDREREQWINEKVELATAILARRVPEYILRNRITDCFSDLDFNQLLEDLLHNNDMNIEYPELPSPEPEMEEPEDERAGPSGVNQGGHLNQDNFDDLFAHDAANNDVEPANQQDEVPPQQTEDYGAVLCDMFPDGDPDFLIKRGEALKDNPIGFEQTVMEFTEKGEYPKMEEFIKRKKRQEEKEKFLNAMDAKEFLELMEDPEKVFSDTSKEVSETYKRNVKDHLANVFPSVLMSIIMRTLIQVNYHLYPAFKILEECKRDKCKRKSNRRQELLSENIDDLFLKELCFLKLEGAIKNYRKDQISNREKELQMAKERGLLQTCPICCEDEILQEEMRPCDADSPHFFCKNCVRRHTEAQIGLGSLRFQCLEGECEEVFSFEVLKTVLKSSVFSNVLKRKQNMEIKAAGIPGLETCPFCDFATVIANKDDKVFHCHNPECMRDSCRFCKILSHIPLTCQEAKDKVKTDTRTYLENEMSEAIVRECYKCGNRFIKEDGCNKMKCMCGAIMCYLCKKQLKDSYEHFYDTNRHQNRPEKAVNRCPLWSNSLELHAKEVKKRAEEAKKNIDPNIELEHDPTKDLPQEPEHRNTSLPFPMFPGNRNPDRRLRNLARLRRQRLLMRGHDNDMNRLFNFNIGNHLHFMNDPPIIGDRDRPGRFDMYGDRENNNYDIFHEHRAAALGLIRNFELPIPAPPQEFPLRHPMYRPPFMMDYMDHLDLPRPPRIPNERPNTPPHIPNEPLATPPRVRPPSPPLLPPEERLVNPERVAPEQLRPNAPGYEHERRMRLKLLERERIRKFIDPFYNHHQDMDHDYNEPLNLADIAMRRNRGRRDGGLDDVRHHRIAPGNLIDAPPSPIDAPPSTPENNPDEMPEPVRHRNEAFRRFPNFFEDKGDEADKEDSDDMIPERWRMKKRVKLPSIDDVDEAAKEPCRCSVQCKGICLNHGIPNSIKVNRKSGVATAWNKKPSWNPRRMIMRNSTSLGDEGITMLKPKRNKSGRQEKEIGIEIPKPRPYKRGIFGHEPMSDENDNFRISPMPGGSGLNRHEPMPGGSGLNRHEPMAGGSGIFRPEPIAGGSGIVRREPIASGSGIVRPEPMQSGSGFSFRDDLKIKSNVSHFSPVKISASEQDQIVASNSPRMHQRSKSFTAGASKPTPDTDSSILPISMSTTVGSNKISVLKQIVGSRVVEKNVDNGECSITINSTDSSDVE